MVLGVLLFPETMVGLSFHIVSASSLITYFESEKEGISCIYKGNTIKSSRNFITKITYKI